MARQRSALNLSRADVHGVLTFYHDFRTRPAGRHVIKLCRAESCQSMGCENLVDHIEQRLGITITSHGATTPDGALTVSPIYCLGNCALSPAVMLDGKPYGRVTPEIADFLINDLKRRDDETLRTKGRSRD